MKPAACPSLDELSAFVLGKLPEDILSRVADHSGRCGKCQKILQGLDAAEDRIVHQIRKAGVPSAANPGLAPLLKKAEALRVETPAVTVSTGDTMGGQPQLTQDLRAVLAPPQGPGEMGRLGRYRVLKLLGHGGMGMVFQAEDPGLQRTVALKVMLPSVAANAAAKERFLREARATAAIEHDHIVTIYQVDEDRGVAYLAMQFLKGMSLEDYIKKAKETNKPLTLGQILKLGREIAKGLSAAHERGLIHRDIKPANIWLDATAGGRAKILDFGLARPAATDSNITQSGMIVGTPAYMAPEQATGQKVDGRADLFSLGVVLYRLCSGRLPWKGETAMATLMAVATEDCKPLAELCPKFPPALPRLVMQLLAKKPEERPKSAKAVVEAIIAIEKEAAGVKVAVPVQAQPNQWELEQRTETAPLVQAPVRKRTRRWPMVAVGLLIAAVGIAAWQVIIRIENKDGSKTEIKVPPGATVALEKDGKTVAQVPGVEGKGADKLVLNPGPGREVDLLKLIDPTKHAVIGNWEFEGKVLVSPRIKPVAAIQVPFTPPEEYEVEAWVTRIQTGDSGHGVVIGLIADHRQFHAIVDDFNGSASGLANIDGKSIADNETLYRGGLLTTGKTSKVICRVQGGKVSVEVDGQAVIGWKGPYSRLSRHGLWTVPQRDQLYLGTTNSEFRISKLVLRPLSGGIDEPWFKTVQSLPPAKQVEAVAKKLQEANPSFNGKLTPTYEGAIVTGLSLSTNDVSDIGPLRAFPRLSVLDLGGDTNWGQGKLADLEPLRGLQLTELNVQGNRKVEHLGPLAGMPLRKLNVGGTTVADLSPLKDSSVWLLNVAGTPVRDLSPLKGLPLSHLYLMGSKVTDLSPLKDTALKVVSLVDTSISDLSPLANKPVWDLHCERTKVQDLSVLRTLPLKQLSCDFDPKRDSAILLGIKTLETINGKPAVEVLKQANATNPAFEQWIKDTQKLPPEKQVEAVAAKLKELNPGFDGNLTPKIGNGTVWEVSFLTDHVTDISPVRGFKGLRNLYCNGSPGRLGTGTGILTDLSPLQGLNLEIVSPHWNPNLRDLTPLRGMKLKQLNVGSTQVSDLTPIAGTSFDHLFCGWSRVTDLTPLKGSPLTTLYSPGTKMDLTTVRDFPIKNLTFDVKNTRDYEILRSMKTLVKINDKPVAEFWKQMDGK
jgi:Leucine-rich repeat (LRR) protein